MVSSSSSSLRSGGGMSSGRISFCARTRSGGDAVRADIDDLAQRGIEAGHGLQWQAVDQVDADRLELRIAGSLDQLAGLLFGLDAVDGDLHLLVEVLHTEAQTVEAQLA